jgi:hypothetical protein
VERKLEGVGDPLKGKLRVSERDVPELGRLTDGNITVTFCDEDGEGVDELPLSDTLPEELVGTSDEASRQIGSLDLKMKSEVLEVRPAGSLKIPQGRKEFTYRPKIVKEVIAIKAEEETDTGVPAVVETRSSIRLTLRRKRSGLAS